MSHRTILITVLVAIFGLTLVSGGLFFLIFLIDVAYISTNKPNVEILNKEDLQKERQKQQRANEW